MFDEERQRFNDADIQLGEMPAVRAASAPPPEPPPGTPGTPSPPSPAPKPPPKDDEPIE